MKPRNELSQEAAENVAIQALNYLASDPERLDRFLALSGLDHASVRAAASEPGFLGGVLEHVAGDEQLLVEFAEFIELKPHEVDRARATLSGQRWQRDIP
jgi:hypothetical protein